MAKQVPSWRLWPWRVITAVSALATGFIALAYGITVSYPRRDVVRCRAGYAEARSVADTIAVDSIEIVMPRAKGRVYSKVHCRSLRGLPE